MLEGVLTCVVSVLLFFLISDFPHQAVWLSEEEKLIVKARLFEDVGDAKAQEPLTLSIVLSVLKDCKWI